PDRLPVFGHDSAAPGFFWCVGQGGFGIQTAPAAGALAAALVEGRAVPFGLNAAIYAPARFD
ncbi:MAG: NAD(P)/FAD-dependent oxidoreductase, partial [Polymorphobacter sp.]